MNKPKKATSTVIPVRVEFELASRLKKRAVKEFRTVQAVIRIAVIAYLNGDK